VEELISYVERALDEMGGILTGLGDELASRRPDLPGANSPYAILRHCLGVMDFWGGQVVAGRTVDRDRDAEFRASGPVAPLIEATAEAKVRFRANAAAAEPDAAVRGAHPSKAAGDLEFVSQGSSLLHVLEEIMQHLGQMELTRDVLKHT
jgi:hypothetical protein